MIFAIFRMRRDDLINAIKQQGTNHSSWADQAIDPIGSTPEELGQYIRREVDKWAKVVKDTGARID